MDILIKFLHQKKQHFAPENGGCQTILSFLGFKDLISKCVCLACFGGVSFAKKTNENFIHQPTDSTNANVLKIPEGFKTLRGFRGRHHHLCEHIFKKITQHPKKTPKTMNTSRPVWFCWCFVVFLRAFPLQLWLAFFA